MKLNIFDFNEFIKLNSCPEVSNPIYLDNVRAPTIDGLFSYELFGLPGSYDRKTIFGYIDLKKNFLHPVIYKALVAMDRNIQYLITGEKYFTIVNGELVKDSKNGETGLSFLYDNWDKLNYKRNASRQRDEKLKLIASLKKEEIFCNKWLVMPAFYRDLDFSKSLTGKINKDAINDLYTRLINLSSSLSKNNGFDFMGVITENKIQTTLVEIYTYCTKPLAKKTGYIRKNLLGKSVDYSYRSVISAPKIGAKNWKKEKIDYIHTGIPLGEACVLFLPFVIKEIRDFLSDNFKESNFISGLKGDKYYLKNPMDDYTDDKIKEIIQLYLSSTEHRFDVLKVNTEIGYKNLKLFYNDLKRDFTITDLLYICVYKVTLDKHVMVTRYPVESYLNIYPTKIHLLSTLTTHEQKLNDRFFDAYPDIIPNYPSEDGAFIDTTILNNAYLEALGGDYDGDMVSIRGIFRQEANKEAEKIIFSKKNFLNNMGENIRNKGKEAIMSLYGLTKD